MRSVALLCPSCEVPTRVTLEDRPTAIDCPACQREVALDPAQLEGEDRLLRCMVCNNKELYHQKDFNRAVGCLIMAVAIGLAVPTYYISLFVGAGIDALLYWRLPWVLVCYKCRSVYRGFDHATHHPYELERAAKYDKYVG